MSSSMLARLAGWFATGALAAGLAILAGPAPAPDPSLTLAWLWLGGNAAVALGFCLSLVTSL